MATVTSAFTNSTFANTTSAPCKAALDYTCSNIGTLLLPMFNESTWSIYLRVLLYIVCLLWCFMGVAIAADQFMCSIEEITSKTKIIKVATENSEENEGREVEEVEIRVWNDTVANLTLMALGSSAPEILLSIIEIVGANFTSGELGPGTIVGSAAFNLLVITAFCIWAIPNGESKEINAFPVFCVTSFFSIFAYVWMFLVMQVITPNVITLVEAIVTLLFFPLLVIMAYIADKNCCGLIGKKRQHQTDEVEMGNVHLLDETIMKKSHPDLIDYIKEITSNPNITEEEAAKLIAVKIQAKKKKNYGHYRVGALRFFGGGRKVEPHLDPKLEALAAGTSVNTINEVEIIESEANGCAMAKMKAKFDFNTTAVSVMEDAKVAVLSVIRTGNTMCRAKAIYETIDGTAERDSDFEYKKETIVFESGEKQKEIEIVIIDDNEWEPDETFFVKLTINPADQSSVETGIHSIAEVTIINDDEPGTFQFVKPSHIVKESCSRAEVEVERVNGADGRVEVPWKTKDQSAKHGSDYIGGTGVVVFEHGETQKSVFIDIVNDQLPEKDETFMIELGELDCAGAKIGRLKRTVVTIVSDDEYQKMFDRVVNMAHMNLGKFHLSSQTWGQQFVEAMNVNGGDVENATALDYVMHIFTFAWKIIFACVPPTSWAGGWLSFGFLISLIGILTAIIGDLATIFGCLIGLRKQVNAITFVALGTSLPDLFASRNAALNEKYADASIGNVTGSNGVNVFLGLGIPWVMAAIYHEINGTIFTIKAGTLATSVITYCVFACVCVALLVVRRYSSFFGKGELGGPSGKKYVSGALLIVLWFMYILVSALVAYEHVDPIKF